MINKKVIIIDHDDSFTFILGQYIGEITGEMPLIVNHSETSIEKIHAYKPSHIILSPGPGTVLKKKDFAIGNEILKEFAGKTPILGICLGHQGIGAYYGGEIIHAPEVMHGKQSEITHNQKGLFKEIPSPLKVMRYHSLIVDSKKTSKELTITAQTKTEVIQDKIIMGLRHKELAVFGLQFHPESVGTKHGKQLLKNFLKF